MAAGRYNIVAEQGATFTLQFTVDTDGVEWDLSTYSARMQVRSSASATTAFLDLSSTDGDITLSAVGVVVVTVDATTMSDVPAGRHAYDLEVESAGGQVTRLLEGKFTVRAEVTQ